MKTSLSSSHSVAAKKCLLLKSIHTSFPWHLKGRYKDWTRLYILWSWWEVAL